MTPLITLKVLDKYTEIRKNKVINLYVQERGKEFTSLIGITSVKKNYGWIQIPNNASTSMRAMLSSQWTTHNRLIEPEYNNLQYLAILRDPVTRFKKGLIQTLYDYARLDKTPATIDNFDEWWETRVINPKRKPVPVQVHSRRHVEDNILKTITGNYSELHYNSHLVRQTDYLIGLNLSNIKFVIMEPGFEDVVRSWTGSRKHFPQKNATIDDPIKKIIVKKLEGIVFNNAEVDDKIRQIYALDYQLLERINSQ